MRIEPVYLVSPPARASQPPTRRAFLLAGAAFAGGTLVGGACGYTVGVQLAAPAEPTKPLDVRLQKLRRLATDAPIDELVANSSDWFTWFESAYPDDEVLWKGVDRIAEWALANESKVEEQLAVRLLGMSYGDKRGDLSFLISNRSKLVALRRTKRQ